MPAELSEQRNSERGAVLVHVALVMLITLGFTAYVLDYGVFWLARNQAQNAADSGALAGAIARSFDEFSAPAAGGPTETSATLTAQGPDNAVMGAPAAVDVTYTCPDFAPEDTSGPCVRVDTFRDSAHGNPLPTYFSNIWGLTSQAVRATATAQVRAGNASSCIKPWIVIDKTPPYSVETDLGLIIDLVQGLAPGPGGLVPSFYMKADLCPTGGGCPNYEQNIKTCYSYEGGCPPYVIGGTIAPFPGAGCPIQHVRGVEYVYNQDPGASWDGSKIVGSCAPFSCSCTNNATEPCANGLNGTISPRIVTIAIADPADIASGRPDYTITNLLSFLLLQPDPANPTNVKGQLVPTVGLEAEGGSVPIGNAFLKIITLVR
jgi:hypothetical protein